MSVALRVAGITWDAWTDVSVSASLETACRSFTVQSPSLALPVDQDVEVLLDGERVLTGTIDRVESTAGGSQATATVSGRSRTCEAVDCSVLHAGRWTGRTVAQIARDVLEPYGVDLVDEASDTTPLGRFAAEEGETCYRAIERAARERGLLLTDDETGALVLTRASAEVGGELRRDRDILSGGAVADRSQVYSEIRCRGARAGSDTDYGAALLASGSATDDGPGRRRVLVVPPDGRADAAACEARARWEVATRYGRALTASYEVAGWRRLDGQLWRPNRMCRVLDPVCGLDASLLVVGVTYTRTGDAFRTQLSLARRDGYVPMATSSMASRGKKAGARGAFWTPAEVEDLKARVKRGAGRALDTVGVSVFGAWWQR